MALQGLGGIGATVRNTPELVAAGKPTVAR